MIAIPTVEFRPHSGIIIIFIQKYFSSIRQFRFILCTQWVTCVFRAGFAHALQAVDFRGCRMLIDPRSFPYRREVILNQSSGESPPLEQDFIVANRLGIHARVAAQIVKTASRFDSEILISKCGVTVNAKSILDLMTLVCPHGSRVHVSARGHDASEAISSLASLFQTKFGEP